MRCPQCRKAIPIESTEHKACGWRAKILRPGEKEEPTPPPPPHDPGPPREEAAATFKRIREKLAAAIQGPQRTPIEHWRYVRDNPVTLAHIREIAVKAIAELERKEKAKASIAADAARMTEARRIVREQEEKAAREAYIARTLPRHGVTTNPPPVDNPAPRPAAAGAQAVEKPHSDPPVTPTRRAAPAIEPGARFSDEDMPLDPLERAILQGDAPPADPRRAAPVSRGTSRAGGSQRPKRSGYARARRT